MAKAKLKGNVVLKLELEEAQFIYGLLGSCVIGSSEKSRRGLSDNICQALEDIEMTVSDYGTFDLNGFVSCEDTKGE